MPVATTKRRRRIAMLGAGVFAVVLVFMSMAVYLHFFSLPGSLQPLHDRGQWTSFGGTWIFSDNKIENISDDRGAKLTMGSPYWTDYIMSADVELEGDTGDAGILARVQEPDEGVDAFRGIYAGLRLHDNALVAGQADYGWTELRPQELAIHLQSFTWYHLELSIKGCHLLVVASLPDGERIGSIDTDLDQCSPRGQIGLRSYRSGGSWRLIRVDPVKNGGGVAP